MNEHRWTPEKISVLIRPYWGFGSIGIEHEHARDVHVLEHVLAGELYFHGFLLVAWAGVSNYLLVGCVTNNEQRERECLGEYNDDCLTWSNLDFSLIMLCSRSLSSRSARAISSRTLAASSRLLRASSSCNCFTSTSFLRRSSSASLTDLRRSCSTSSFLLTVFCVKENPINVEGNGSDLKRLPENDVSDLHDVVSRSRHSVFSLWSFLQLHVLPFAPSSHVDIYSSNVHDDFPRPS